jgi:hypothetical protein
MSDLERSIEPVTWQKSFSTKRESIRGVAELEYNLEMVAAKVTPRVYVARSNSENN